MITSRGRLAAAALVTALALVPAAAAAAQTTPGDDLTQVIDPNQAQGSGRVVLDRGHIDFGPTLNTGEWIIQIHDDTSSPSFWRHPDDVVAKVNDTARLTVPADEAYSFLGLEPGSDAWVVPQTRNPDVIWAGWNTQEPNVLDALNLGTTLSVLGVDGPGQVTVYLQAGNFGDLQPLWSTLQPFPQQSWIEVNTHTHANWVFSEPGVYLVEIEFSADLRDGRSVSARDTLRFAVGDQTDAEAVFDLQPDSQAIVDEPLPEAEADPGSEADTEQSDAGGTGMLVGIVVGIVAAALLIAVIVVVIASGRARAKARATRGKGRAE